MWVQILLLPPSWNSLKLFLPPFKGMKTFYGPPPFSIWLKLKCPVLSNYLETFCAPDPFSMAKIFHSPPPLFVGVQLSTSSSHFVAPPPHNLWLVPKRLHITCHAIYYLRLGSGHFLVLSGLPYVSNGPPHARLYTLVDFYWNMGASIRRWIKHWYVHWFWVIIPVIRVSVWVKLYSIK